MREGSVMGYYRSFTAMFFIWAGYKEFWMFMKLWGLWITTLSAVAKVDVV
ncbi:MAG: hypothetical protein JW717_09320 [Marinilabiliaceae bacterium]|nr:hypothetical protein [Marinilabiliaceae bacterium]